MKSLNLFASASLAALAAGYPAMTLAQDATPAPAETASAAAAAPFTDANPFAHIHPAVRRTSICEDQRWRLPARDRGGHGRASGRDRSDRQQLAPPTFDNTLVAMERSGQPLTRAYAAFGAVLSANTNDS
ncbi:MAG: hypothetical protein R3D83_08495 [Caenibius sp.]